MTQKRMWIALAVFCLALTLAVSALCWPAAPSNYRNSDATWHVLYTVQAYDETPVATHRFLPIVTLGAADDKGLVWGNTVMAADGNAYYTSFSPAGYVLPWAFFKVLGLPVAESSLYILNRTILFLSLLTLCWVVWDTFRASRAAPVLCVTAAALYTLAPEMLHGTGVVYWHQSLFQLVFLWQLAAYRRAPRRRGAAAWLLALCVLAPYVEWTGYPANAGFALAWLVDNWRGSRRRALAGAAAVGGATLLGGGAFIAHYAGVLGLPAVLDMLQNRFFARSVSSSVAYTLRGLLVGYINSFYMLWPAAAALAAVGLLGLVCKKGRGPLRPSALRPYAGLAIALCAPMLENVVMMRHAVDYTYDRMKLVFPLVFAVCGVCAWLAARWPKRITPWIALAVVAAAGLYNLHFYCHDNTAVWPAPFRAVNQQLADRLQGYRQDSVIATPTEVRGYLNLLLQRGVHEYVFYPEELLEQVRAAGKRYLIYLCPQEDPAMGSSMYAYTEAIVYDTLTDTVYTLPAQG